MAYYPKSNPCYRTKDAIIADVVLVLNSQLAYGTQQAVLQDAAWTWTEFHGKYDGCKSWSQDAKLQKLAWLNKSATALEAQLDGQQAELPAKPKWRHEHAVPRSMVIQMLRSLNPATPEAVCDICERLLHGVVVTLEEDARFRAAKLQKTMPAAFFDEGNLHFQNPWLRYLQCGVKVLPPPTDWPA